MRKLAVHELGRLSESDYRSVPKRRITVVLDNIRSAHNVGSIFRTCDAFLVEKVALCGYSARPPHKDILKTALGAADIVPWEHFAAVGDCLDSLRTSGYCICAVEHAEGSVMLGEYIWEKERPYALVFGNEVGGVGEEVVAGADVCIEVPQWGTKHSLNVSVCAGIVLWDCVRAVYT